MSGNKARFTVVVFHNGRKISRKKLVDYEMALRHCIDLERKFPELRGYEVVLSEKE